MGVEPTGGSDRRQIAETLFHKLDAKDGIKNQQIEAPVWNAYVSANGTGKPIKNFITKENAINSNMTYLSRKANADISIDALGEEWGNMDRIDNKTDDNGVFKKDPNPPTSAEKETAKPELGKLEDRKTHIHKETLVNMYKALAPAGTDVSKMTSNEIINTKFEQYKGQVGLELPAGSGKFFFFDEEGFINLISNDNFNTLLYIAQDNGTRYVESECAYNEDGFRTQSKNYDIDGTLESEYTYCGTDEPNQYKVDYYNDHTKEWIYPSAETNEFQPSKKIFRDLDGNVIETYEYEYNEDGSETKTIIRDADGNVTHYEEYEYDDLNDWSRTIIRDKDGNVTDVYDAKRKKYIIENGKRV